MTPFLEVNQLSKLFRLKKEVIYSVYNLSFTLTAGQSLGLGGESGCGKSTLAKLLMQFLKPTTGSISFEGKDLIFPQGCLPIQMIFQHPASSLNPSFTVEKTLKEPLNIHHLGSPAYLDEEILRLLHQVGLSKEYLKRFPHELSGGQQQRIAIARALSINPRLLICDEPFSALDKKTQIQVIQLLQQLKQEKGLTYLIISHDLSVLHSLCDHLAIMYLGEFVEYGPSLNIYYSPLHPYSQALISSILTPYPLKKREKRIFLKEALPQFSQKGCSFFGRCPYSKAICKELKPPWKEIKPGHFSACHLL